MSTEPKIDWNKPLQTVRGWNAEVVSRDAIYIGIRPQLPNERNLTFFYRETDDGKSVNDGLPHGENPYDLMNVPEPEPAPDPIEALRAEVAELRERLAKIEAEKQAEGVAAEGVDWSKPLETFGGKPAEFLQADKHPEYPCDVRVDGAIKAYTKLGKFFHNSRPRGEHAMDLRNVVST